MPIALTAESLMSALGTAVLHFMWQGTLIGMLGALLLASMRRGPAPARYAVGCAAMACCVLSFLATFVLALVPGPVHVSVLFASPKHAGAVVAPAAGGSERLLDAVAWTWLAGFIVLAARLALQSHSAHRLATASVTRPDTHWQKIFDDLKAELGVGRAVRFLRSAVAESPMVVGWISPIVLVPVWAFTTLTPEQLRALLVHELAHIRRYDHLVNAAQVVIETVLFFHPLVWWLSGRVRLEREHCCDDAAVRSSASPRVLAEALVKLESLRIAHPQAALAANGGPLMNRISRLLGTDRVSRNSLPGWRTAVAIAAGAFVAAAGLAQPGTPRQPPSDDQVLEMLRDLAATGSSTEEVRDLYSALVYTGSAPQQKIDAELASVEARLKAAVQGGKLTPAEAAAKLEGARKEREEHVDLMFRVDVLGMTKDQAHATITREKLERAVRSGRITPEEAERKIAALERANDPRREVAEHLERARAEIRNAVAAGELSEEQAQAKMAALEKEAAEHLELQAAAQEIRAAVAAGKITPEEAAAKMDGLKRRMMGGDKVAAELGALKLELRRKVAAGELSEEQARAQIAGKLAGIEQELVARKRLENAHAEIKAALDAGKITPEEAAEKMDDLKRRMMGGGKEAAELEALKLESRRKVLAGELSEEQARAKMAGIEKELVARKSLQDAHAEIKAALDTGKITPEQAAEKLEVIKKRMADSGTGRPVDWDAIKRRVEGAVERGDMTREQADETYRKIKERAAAGGAR